MPHVPYGPGKVYQNRLEGYLPDNSHSIQRMQKHLSDLLHQEVLYKHKRLTKYWMNHMVPGSRHEFPDYLRFSVQNERVENLLIFRSHRLVPFPVRHRREE